MHRLGDVRRADDEGSGNGRGGEGGPHTVRGAGGGVVAKVFPVSSPCAPGELWPLRQDETWVAGEPAAGSGWARALAAGGRVDTTVGHRRDGRAGGAGGGGWEGGRRDALRVRPSPPRVRAALLPHVPRGPESPPALELALGSHRVPPSRRQLATVAPHDSVPGPPRRWAGGALLVLVHQLAGASVPPQQVRRGAGALVRSWRVSAAVGAAAVVGARTLVHVLATGESNQSGIKKVLN